MPLHIQWKIVFPTKATKQGKIYNLFRYHSLLLLISKHRTNISLSKSFFLLSKKTKIAWPFLFRSARFAIRSIIIIYHWFLLFLCIPKTNRFVKRFSLFFCFFWSLLLCLDSRVDFHERKKDENQRRTNKKKICRK